MRIIRGNLKGKKLQFINSLTTRPLRDYVKENIFNIIEHSNLINIEIINSHVLDAYSGVGSFGIECFSRGANEVSFVENSNEAIKILKKNLNNLNLDKKAFLEEKSIINFLNQTNKKFNIFFFDPPYKNKDYINSIKIIKKKNLFKKKHIIIIHREFKTDENFQDFIDVLMIKTYGRSKIIFGTIS